jgi:hypothetical protein
MEVFPVGTEVEAVSCKRGNLIATIPCEGFAMAQGLHLVVSGATEDLYEIYAQLQTLCTRALALAPRIGLVMITVGNDSGGRMANLQLKLAHKSSARERVA